ncbi:hypothetical protein MesoLj113c_15680 [Mesorhizobium sp. 113-3-9]|nr:hypothetical protein MesoLj113c_15680 [Mesorhizobium sp. 113-3-9]
MDLQEEMLCFALRDIDRLHGADIKTHFGVSVEIPADKILRLDYRAALELLNRSGLAIDRRLTHQSEQMLCRYAKEKTGCSFVYIENFPATDRPFYTMRSQDSEIPLGQAVTRSFDLFWRGAEISSGCQREHDHERLKRQMASDGFSPEIIQQYLEPYFLEMFLYGCPPHGGFGIGLDRFLMILFGCSSIEETSFVHRSSNRFVP